MKDSLALCEQFEAEKYDIYLSQMMLDEVGECPEPKRTVLFESLSRISYTKLEIANEVLKVANQITKYRSGTGGYITKIGENHLGLLL